MAAPVMHQIDDQDPETYPIFPYRAAELSHQPEDIIFCVDVDRAVDTEMRGATSTRLVAIKQALLLFVTAKLAIDPRHRFAVMTLGDTAKWLHREFTNNVESLQYSIQSLSSQGLFLSCDLLGLFKTAAAEAKARTDRTVRVILVYVRSSVLPTMNVEWPATLRSFTCDAIYLHDKPNRDNCPQEVYDALVQFLESVSSQELYILESAAGIAKTVFKSVCVLLAHPQQRAPQDELGEFPRDLAKMFPPPPPPDPVPPPPMVEEKKRKEDKKGKEEKKVKEDKKAKSDDRNTVTIIHVTRPGEK